MRAKLIARRRSGFTLLEFSVSISMLVVVSAAIAMVVNSSSKAFRTGATMAAVDASARRVMEEICGGLKATSAANVSPTPQSPFSSMLVDFQRGLGTKDGATVWGVLERIELQNSPSDPNDGEDNDGNGLLDECRIVWTSNPGQPNERQRIIASGVAEYLEGELPNGKDDNGNGLIDERGLCLDYGTDSVTIHLTLQDVGAEGFLISSTVRKTIAFRNEGAAPQ